jgi:ADP-heptose:LPS heptosyltransferase
MKTYQVYRWLMPPLVKAIDSLHWAVSRWVLDAATALFTTKHRPFPRTVYVLRNCFFGDFIVAIPALRRLRTAFPKAEIVFVTAASFAAGWRDQPQTDDVFNIEPGLIDRIIRYTPKDLTRSSSRAALRARFLSRAEAITLVLCYPSESLRSRLKRIVLAKALGLPFPLGLTGTPTLPAPHWLNRWRMNRVDVEHTTTAALRCVDEALVSLGLDPRLVEVATNQNSKHTGPTGRKLIGIAPFTKQPVKQWPLERFNATMRQLASDFDATFEIYGAPEEREQAKKLDRLLNGAVEARSLCGDLTPLELRNRIESLDLLVCLDSGPAHVASLVGTPVVAVFPQITLHNFWRPWGPGGVLVSTAVPCAACDTRSGQCPLGTKACIDGVSVEMVLHHARQTLNYPH